MAWHLSIDLCDRLGYDGRVASFDGVVPMVSKRAAEFAEADL